MNKQMVSLIAATLALCAAAPGAAAHRFHAGAWLAANQGIILDEGAAVIHGRDGGTARIAADGTLYIEGESVAVSAAQKRQLARYVATVKDIERRGLELGAAAGDFAAGLVGEVFAALLTGADAEDIDRKAESRSHAFAGEALSICRDMQQLKRIQDQLATAIAAFRPYAVIAGKDAADCKRDVISGD